MVYTKHNKQEMFLMIDFTATYIASISIILVPTIVVFGIALFIVSLIHPEKLPAIKIFIKYGLFLLLLIGAATIYTILTYGKLINP